MSVYVDDEANPFGRMIMCHMFADTLDELNTMAALIGLRREWLQLSGSFPHYDVAKGRRAEAVRFGAVEVDRRGGYEIRNRLKADANFMDAWKVAYAAMTDAARGGEHG